MDRQVGVVREAATLRSAVQRLSELSAREDDDLSLVALQVAQAALAREESRGGHFRADFPAAAAEARHSETALGNNQPAATEVRRVA
jgi:L-aspartate oxidase